VKSLKHSLLRQKESFIVFSFDSASRSLVSQAGSLIMGHGLLLIDL
jgi:hypothetical protein